MNIAPETATEVTRRIQNMLVLGKAENREAKLLATLGLFNLDFSRDRPLAISWDALGVLVKAAPFSGTCTCKDDKKNPKVHRIPEDPELHTSQCDVYRLYALGIHDNLAGIEMDAPAGGEPFIAFDFFWPRTFNERQRNVLTTQFGELQIGDLWKNFVKGWDGIMKLLPPPPPPYRECLDAEESPEGSVTESASEIQTSVEQVAQTPAAEEPMSFNFDDDLNLSDGVDMPGTDAPNSEATTPGPQPSLEEQVKATAKKRGRKPKAALDPATSTTESATEPSTQGAVVVDGPIPDLPGPVVTGPGSEKEPDLAPDTANSEPTPAKNEKPRKNEKKDEKKKRLPALLKFKDMATEELAGLASSIDFIAENESFPIEAIKQLKGRLDRLALKAAHLAYRGGHEKDAPGAINPIIEVTLANAVGATNSAVRDLGLSPEKPNSWADFRGELKKVMEIADSMSDIMAQTGMGDAIQEPPKLKDKDGKALVP